MHSYEHLLVFHSFVLGLPEQYYDVALDVPTHSSLSAAAQINVHFIS